MENQSLVGKPFPTLSMKDFRQLGDFISSKLGIKMPDAKRGMVESRLRKRLNALKIDSYGDYCTYLFSPLGMQDELPYFVNEITTNKTDFFREPNHFSYLYENALPGLTKNRPHQGRAEISVWSTACSRGHEPYTLAMVLDDYLNNSPSPGVGFSILGTDISTKVLNHAKKAVYTHEEINPVPMNLRRQYLLRSRDRKKNLVRIVPQLRSRVTFRKLNLMDGKYPVNDYLDIIFCRNVMIYFDRDVQEKLLARLCTHLKTGGYLFVGHSEVINCNTLPLVNAAPTIYRKI